LPLDGLLPAVEGRARGYGSSEDQFIDFSSNDNVLAYFPADYVNILRRYSYIKQKQTIVLVNQAGTCAPPPLFEFFFHSISPQSQALPCSLMPTPCGMQWLISSRFRCDLTRTLIIIIIIIYLFIYGSLDIY
jgi:hypothetical protein